MKILRITVHNIASLAGTHTVDFMQEPLRSAGLYAISGATGAGKSSLLDALCLALFDATPRLRQVGRLEEVNDGERQNDPRTLLRRGTASGFAEVVFEGVDQQIWTARWSVRRSRNRVEGRLQKSEMVLFRGPVASGRNGPLEAGGKKTEVQPVIVEKLGLTFDQFTRAVLLAQNEFSTFLKSSDRERAEILQALTGTERFEQISQAVFQRNTDETEQLEQLESRLTGQEPLSTEDREQAEGAVRALEVELRQTTSSLQQVDVQLKWFEELQHRQTAFGEAAEQLQLAKQAQHLADELKRDLQQTELIQREAGALWRDVGKTREAVQTAEAEHRSSQTKLEAAETALTASRTQLSAVETRSLEMQKYADRRLQEIQQARELDARLEPLQENRQRVRLDLQTRAAARDKIHQQLQTDQKRSEALTRRHQEQVKQLGLLSVWESLVPDAARWQQLLDDALQAEQECASLRVEQEQAQQAALQHQQQLESLLQECQNREQQRDAVRQKQIAAEKQEQKRNAADLLSARTELDNELSILTRLQQEIHEQRQLEHQYTELSAELQSLQGRLSTDTQQLQQLVDQLLPQAETAWSTAAEQLRRLQAAMDDHAQRLRTELRPGSECPVCGATEHPYADATSTPQAAAVAESMKFVAELEQKKQQRTAEQQQLHLRIDDTTRQQQKLQPRLSDLHQQIDRFEFGSSSHPTVMSVLQEATDQRKVAVETRLKQLNEQRSILTEQERELQQLRTQQGEYRRQEQQAEQKLEQARQELAEQKKAGGRTEHQLTALTTRLETAEQLRKNTDISLSDVWTAVPRARDTFRESADEFCQEFESRISEFLTLQQERQTTEGELATLTPRLQELQQRFEAAQQDVSAIDLACRAAELECDQLEQQRSELLGSQTADQAAQQLSQQQENVAEQLQQTRQIHADAAQQQSLLRQQQQQKQDVLQQQLLEQQQSADGLATWLETFAARFGYKLSEDDIQVCLGRTPQWIEEQQHILKTTDDAVTSAQGRQDVLQRQLDQHLETRPAVPDETEVRKRQQSLKEQLDTTQQRHTDAAAILTLDDDRRKQNADLQEQIEQQRRIAHPWQQLNDVIGSRDGARFRRIAQRRTLDVLLGYANHQLHQLSARYRLERIPESLNLIVIDEEMAEERRSVHSLSGGESFLVSLSLALGLASLTSNRLKIESLFIDEGFGSLDPETLNTAVSALMQLEAQGRKVGVISHVAEMADAIPVQIQVIKGRGGASRVLVPGAADSKTDISFTDPSDGPTQTAVVPPSSHPPTSVLVPPPTVSLAALGTADQIMLILEREHREGNQRVSTQKLAQEIGCELAELQAAEQLLEGLITGDGQHLQLAAS